MKFKIKLLLIIIVFFNSYTMFSSELKEDEDVILYPTYLYLDKSASEYKVKIHLHVFKKKENSIKRKILIQELEKYLKVSDEDNSKIFQERIRSFLVDNKRGKRVSVRVLGQDYALKETEANGRSITEIKIPKKSILENTNQIEVNVNSSSRNKKEYKGKIWIIPEDSTCVISDVDDTIKLSDVRNKKKLLENSFIKPFEKISGMNDYYSSLTSNVSCFLFVSASPWQMYNHLSKFFLDEKFPESIYFMKDIRLKDWSVLNLFESPDNYKIQKIEPILKEWKNVKFILVGDSGEKDPEAYATLFRKYPDQIKKIYIRVAYDENLEERIKRVFSGIEKDKYFFFKDPREIKE